MQWAVHARYRMSYESPKAGKGIKTDSMDHLHAVLIRASGLLLDDPGVEYGGSFLTSIYAALIDRRYAMNKPIVVATNLSYNDLRSNFPRSGDRLASGEHFGVLSLAGKRYRQVVRELKTGR